MFNRMSVRPSSCVEVKGRGDISTRASPDTKKQINGIENAEQ